MTHQLVALVRRSTMGRYKFGQLDPQRPMYCPHRRLCKSELSCTGPIKLMETFDHLLWLNNCLVQPPHKRTGLKDRLTSRPTVHCTARSVYTQIYNGLYTTTSPLSTPVPRDTVHRGLLVCLEWIKSIFQSGATVGQ